jgi:hypothetical protein
MNRRSFFRSLALLSSAAAVAPDIFLPKFQPVRWTILQAKTLVVNLEWLDARYEFVEQFSPPPVGPMVCTLEAMRPVLETWLNRPHPCKFPANLPDQLLRASELETSIITTRCSPCLSLEKPLPAIDLGGIAGTCSV